MVFHANWAWFGSVFFSSSKPVDVSAIDHLPSVLPRESSERFANKMTSYLLKLDKVRNITETTEHNLIRGSNVSASWTSVLLKSTEMRLFQSILRKFCQIFITLLLVSCTETYIYNTMCLLLTQILEARL